MNTEEFAFSKNGMLKIEDFFRQLPICSILKRKESKETLAKIESASRESLSLKQFANFLNDVFLEHLDLEKSVFAFSLDRKNHLFFIANKDSSFSIKKFVFNEKASRYLRESNKLLTEKEIFDFFDILPISLLQTLKLRRKKNLIFPLELGKGSEGFILLSRKNSGKVFSSKEVIWLENAIKIFSKSLTNSYLNYKLERIRLKFKKELARRNIKFSKEVQAQQKYLSKLSHEVRSPLAIIKSYLLSAAEGEPLDYELVVNQVQILSQLLEDIVFLARLDSGCLKLERGYVNLTAVIEDILQELELVALDRGITLKNYCQKGIYLSADQLNLKKALAQIILNAILYNKKGGMVEIYTSQKRNGIKIAILDTGIGMNEEICQKAFTLFYCGGVRETGKYRGNGLGLSIARKIILKQGGEIKIESEPNKGTAVIVKLNF
jgi:signal transduction histidine kinase